MIPRAFLFTPGDAPAKMEKALASGADAVILDLEDSVAEANKPAARAAVAAFLAVRPHPRKTALWVRINPLSSPCARADLAAIVSASPDGIVLPKPESGATLIALARMLDALGDVEGCHQDSAHCHGNAGLTLQA